MQSAVWGFIYLVIFTWEIEIIIGHFVYYQRSFMFSMTIYLVPLFKTSSGQSHLGRTIKSETQAWRI